MCNEKFLIDKINVSLVQSFRAKISIDTLSHLYQSGRAIRNFYNTCCLAGHVTDSKVASYFHLKNLPIDFCMYFVCISARLSGTDPDDEELEEVEELERLTSLANQSLWTRLKKMVLELVERVGFFGILVCASVSKNS